MKIPSLFPLYKLWTVIEFYDDVEIILGYILGEPSSKWIRHEDRDITYQVLWADGHRVYVREVIE